MFATLFHVKHRTVVVRNTSFTAVSARIAYRLFGQLSPVLCLLQANIEVLAKLSVA
jgi:hypothetical protein